MKYDFRATEKKWQDKWEETGVFKATEDHSKPKFYGLVEFPYPSGAECTSDTSRLIRVLRSFRESAEWRAILSSSR